MTSAVPTPPGDFAPLTATLHPGTVLYRAHATVVSGNVQNDGTLPNPGVGQRTRFGLFGDPTVPILYAASSPEAAVHESLLHSMGPGAILPMSAVTHWAITPLEVTRPLTLVSYRGAGLRRFGLYPRDLTDTLASEYSATVRWAEAAWTYGADGVGYMCRHFNHTAAYCLFGADHRGALRAQSGFPPRRHPGLLQRDREWLAAVAAEVGIHIDVMA